MDRKGIFWSNRRYMLSIAAGIGLASCSMQQDVARSSPATATTVELQDSERSQLFEYVGVYIGSGLSYDLLSTQSQASLSRIGVQNFDGVYAAQSAGNQQEVFQWLGELADSLENLSDAEFAILGLDMRGVIYEQRLRAAADT